MPHAKITVCLDEPIGRINPFLYGHFAEHLGACVYDGLCVDENSKIPNLGGIRKDVVEALKKVRVPVLRWPGGCFADDYHWRDGVGPRARRPRRVNIWWGDAIETNHFGTHEFLQLCRLIGAEPYLAGNLGSGSPGEMRDWVEYCNFAGDSTLAQERAAHGAAEPFRVKYWGVGNENWGCGGHFCPEDYAAAYKRYATFLHEFPGAPLFLIACGPNGNDADWTRRFFAKLQRFGGIHGCAAHYYCGTAGTATEYSADQWYELLDKSTAMEALILQQRQILDDFSPQRRIELIVDEWGTWHPPTPGRNPKHLWQQNTLRDALVAAITLDIFNKHADKVFMANIAQAVNVLQALLLTHEDKLVLTPTYHVFQMYQMHQGARSVRAQIEAEPIGFVRGNEKRQLAGLLGSASISGDVLTLSVVNTSADVPVEAALEFRGGRARHASGLELSHADLRAHNTFEAPETLKPRALPALALGGASRYVFPPASVTVLRAPL